jgi:hypothetical protein
MLLLLHFGTILPNNQYRCQVTKNSQKGGVTHLNEIISTLTSL